MSDWDGTDTGHEDNGYGDAGVDAGEQHYDLDHNAQAYGEQHDASQDYSAYGEANEFEKDVNFEQGHHVEYDNPNGTHYEETDYTSLNSHEAASSAAYGEQYSAESHDSSFANLEHLRESFDAQYLHADGYDGGQYDGGAQQELSAASN